MPALENAEQVDKTLSALRDYQAAMKKVSQAQAAAHEKLGVLKSITGIAANDPVKIEEECLLMVGRAHVHGVMDR